GPEALLRLSGEWLVHDGSLQAINEIGDVGSAVSRCTRLAFDTSSVSHWDSSLLAFISRFLDSIEETEPGAEAPAEPPIDIDLSGLPEPLRRLLALVQGDHHVSHTH